MWLGPDVVAVIFFQKREEDVRHLHLHEEGDVGLAAAGDGEAEQRAAGAGVRGVRGVLAAVAVTESDGRGVWGWARR